MKKFKEYIQEVFSQDQLPELSAVLRKFHNRRIVFTDSDYIRSFEVKQTKPSGKINISPKPKGLWYARGEEWSEFLQYWPDSPIDSYKNIFYIEIDYTNVLRINTAEKFKKFQEEYYESVESENAFMRFMANPTTGINWAKLAEKYKGIEIIPYRWEERESNWYYGWDLASGCVWDSTAIKHSVHIYNDENGFIYNKTKTPMNHEKL